MSADACGTRKFAAALDLGVGDQGEARVSVEEAAMVALLRWCFAVRKGGMVWESEPSDKGRQENILAGQFSE